MQSLPYVFLYLQKPELFNLSSVKNFKIHNDIAYLKQKLVPIKGTTLPYDYVVARNFGCPVSKFDEIRKSDEFVSKMRGYWMKNRMKAKELIEIKYQKPMKEIHINILYATIYKSNLRFLILSDCNLNDFFFSKLCWLEFKHLRELNLNNNNLTNQTVKNLSKMIFSNSFERLEISMNKLDEDAIRIIMNSKNFHYINLLSIFLREDRIKKKKIPFKDISKIRRLCVIICNIDAFEFEVDYETDSKDKYFKLETSIVNKY